MHPTFSILRSTFSIRNILPLTLLSLLLVWNTAMAAEPPANQDQPEPHLANIRQLTFSGKNAEAYFSDEGNRLVYQSTLEPDGKTLRSCYQIYIMDLDGTNVRRVSLGLGRHHVRILFPRGPACPFFLHTYQQSILSTRPRKDRTLPVGTR